MTGIQLGYTVTSFYKKGLKKVPAELSQDGPTGADRQKKEEGRGEDAGMEGDFMPADFDDHHRRYSRLRRGRLAGGGR